MWMTCLIVLFSSLLHFPAVLMNANSLLSGTEGMDAYIKVIVAAAALCIVCIAVSIPIINKKQL